MNYDEKSALYQTQVTFLKQKPAVTVLSVFDDLFCVVLFQSIKDRSRSIKTANRKLKESSRQRRSLLLASKKYQV